MQAFVDASENFSEAVVLQSKLDGPRYTDGELVGSGGAKLVYATKDNLTGRSLVRAYPKSSDYEDDFLREASLHAQLEHPNIIPFYDLGLEAGTPYFCMKQIHGESLDLYITNLDSTESSDKQRNSLLDIFTKVCDAVSYAHSIDVLHLDIKPSNIQISSYGEVLVGDWGLARSTGSLEAEYDGESMQSSGQFTRHGYLSGTPGFMAPEQCEKGSVKTPQTDVFALGSLLVFILTGRPALTGAASDVMHATLQGSWNYNEESIPLGLKDVIKKALAVDLDQRYASVNDLQLDLNSYRSGFLTTAESFTTRRLLQTLYLRNRKTIHLSAIAIILGVSLTTLFIVKIRKSEAGAQLASESALAEKKNAEEALNLFSEAESEKQKLGQQFASNYLNESVHYYYDVARGRHDYVARRDQRAYQLVSRALELDPTNLEAWALKGRLAMLTMRFEEAIIAFDKAGDDYKLHRSVCKEFSDKDLADLKVRADMLWRLLPSDDLRLLHDFMFLTIFTMKNDPDLLYFIEEGLNIRYLGDKPRLHFTYDSAEQALDMSGNPQLIFIFMIKNLPLRTLNLSQTNVAQDIYHIEKMPLIELNMSHTPLANAQMKWLRGKPLWKLNIAHTSVTKLRYLDDLPLESLNICGTKISNFLPLIQLSSLKVVVCDENQALLIRQQIPQLKDLTWVLEIKND